jgi:hypothetical protein
LCFLFSSRLPGGGITFFAAAKKVIKESSFLNQTLHVEKASGLMVSLGNNSAPPRRPARPVKGSVRIYKHLFFLGKAVRALKRGVSGAHAPSPLGSIRETQRMRSITNKQASSLERYSALPLLRGLQEQNR